MTRLHAVGMHVDLLSRLNIQTLTPNLFLLPSSTYFGEEISLKKQIEDISLEKVQVVSKLTYYK